MGVTEAIEVEMTSARADAAALGAERERVKTLRTGLDDLAQLTHRLYHVGRYEDCPLGTCGHARRVLVETAGME